MAAPFVYNVTQQAVGFIAAPVRLGKAELNMTLEGLRTLQNIEEILKANGIEGDPAEAIAKAVGENYKTVAEVEQKAKKLTETQAALDNANKALDEAKKAAESADVDGLKAKIAEYEEAAKKRTEADEEAKKRATFDEKFGNAVGDKKFVNDIVRDAVADKAYAIAKANPDMDVAAILGGIVSDAEGVWQNPQQTVKKMPAASGNGGSAAGTQAIQNIEDLKGMSVEEIRAHMDEVNKVLSNQK